MSWVPCDPRRASRWRHACDVVAPLRTGELSDHVNSEAVGRAALTGGRPGRSPAAARSCASPTHGEVAVSDRHAVRISVRRPLLDPPLRSQSSGPSEPARACPHPLLAAGRLRGSAWGSARSLRWPRACWWRSSPLAACHRSRGEVTLAALAVTEGVLGWPGV